MDSRADWNNWLQEAGIDDAGVTHGPVLNRASMVIDAAINGQGIALGAYHARGMGSHKRSSGAAFPASAATGQDLLDRVPEGDCEPAEDRDLSRLAVGGSLKRPAPAEESWLVATARALPSESGHVITLRRGSTPSD